MSKCITSTVIRRAFCSETMSETNLKNFAGNCRKIVGAALNYGSRSAGSLKDPVLFLKPTSSLITEGQTIKIPKAFTSVYHEVELGVIIKKACRNVSVANAMDYVGGYCLTLDLTAMCFVGGARKSALPWDLSKAFDTATPVSRFISPEELPNPHDTELWCKVNGELRQKGSTAGLLFNIPELISFTSKYMTLEPNDLILSGTPTGAGPIKGGDVIECGLSGNLVTFRFPIENDV